MLYNIASGDSTARGKMGAKVGALGKSTVRTQRKRRWQRTWEKLCKCVLPPEIRKRVYKRNGLMKKKNKTEESQLKNLKCFKKFSRFNLRAVKIITIKYIHISIFHTCLCVCVCVKERNLRCSKNFWKKSFSRSMRRLIFLTVAPVRDRSRSYWGMNRWRSEPWHGFMYLQPPPLLSHPGRPRSPETTTGNVSFCHCSVLLRL